MNEITWSEFEAVELRAGTILAVSEFPEAKKPAYKITVDFGEFGIKNTSAQITVNYTPESLVGKQIVGVINFPPKQIGPFVSEFLLTGFHDSDGSVIITTTEKTVPNGAKLC